jgi:hypothetical protein
VIWVHITLLDLFYVNLNGIVFLWQQNSEFKTLATHVSIAVLTVLFYFVINKLIRLFSVNENCDA